MEEDRVKLLQKLYDGLFNSGNSLSKCKDSIISERLYLGSTDTTTVAGRSLAWKLFLSKEEPLQNSLPPRTSALLHTLQQSRDRYTTLLEDQSRAPDGSRHGKSPSVQDLQAKSAHSRRDLDLINPLSLHNENPWNEWFAGVELRKVVSQDVERTFPEIAFFRDAEVQTELTNILFLYSLLNPSVGYRQGMHELLAPLYYAVHFDAILENEIEDNQYKDLERLCAIEFVAADSWGLFNFVMNGVSKWYEWREPDGQNLTTSLASFPNHVIIPNGQNGIRPYVAPIVQACNHIQSTLLQACDPVLWRHLQKAGIEPQIYGIRWLRLLFTREFSMPDAMKLWDCLFACDASLDLAQWVCVAMLIRIRNELIPADYSGQLTTLLRYPTPLASSKTEGAPHHAILLIRQALALQMAPNPATGSSIVIENRNLLGIPVDVPSAPSVSETRRSRAIRQTHSSSQVDGSGSRSHARQTSVPAVGLSEMFTRGLVERGESLGINKTLMSAVTEIRRNIPELAASLGVKTPNQQLSSFPLLDERPVEERPPWEPKTRFEVEKELAQMRTRDKYLGESLAWIVDTLLQDEGDGQDAEKMKLKKREALESLSYVRDVLMTNEATPDVDRLVGEEEKTRRKLKAQKESEALQAASALAVVAPPSKVPVTDSQHSNIRRIARPRSPGTTPSAPSMAKPVDGMPQRAPWNYTRSSFGAPASAIPSALMPRPPPPTSTSLRRENRKSRDQTPPPKEENYQDPLGALR